MIMIIMALAGALTVIFMHHNAEGIWFSGVLVPFTVFGLVIGVMLSVAVAIPLPKEDGPVITRDLQAISVNSGAQGQFFLGTGSVDEVQSYIFYVKNDDGTYQMEDVPSDSTTIREVEGEPRIEERQIYFNDFVIPFEGMRHWDSKYVIYVPPGSVRPMVDLDLPN